MYLSAGFGDAEEGKRKGKKTEGSKEDVCAPCDGLEHIRGDKANDAARCSLLDSNQIVRLAML